MFFSCSPADNNTIALVTFAVKDILLEGDAECKMPFASAMVSLTKDGEFDHMDHLESYNNIPAAYNGHLALKKKFNFV
jgi:hypothetical protein